MADKESIPQKKAMVVIAKTVAGTMIPVSLGVYYAYNHLKWDMPELSTASERLIYTLQWHGLSSAVLYNMIENVANERSKNAWNPLDANNQGNTVILNKVLTNTTEQFVAFVPSTLILATYLEPHQMKIIPIFVVQWALARMAFQYGYLKHPLYRGPGMSASIMPTMFSLAAIAYLQYKKGPVVLATLTGLFAFKRFLSFMDSGVFPWPWNMSKK